MRTGGEAFLIRPWFSQLLSDSYSPPLRPLISFFSKDGHWRVWVYTFPKAYPSPSAKGIPSKPWFWIALRSSPSGSYPTSTPVPHGRLPTSPVSASSILTLVITAAHALLNRKSRWYSQQGNKAFYYRSTERDNSLLRWANVNLCCPVPAGTTAIIGQMGDASVYFQVSLHDAIIILYPTAADSCPHSQRLGTSCPCLDPT